MPISDLGSHVVVGEEFKSHWGAVNASRVAAGGAALVLLDGYSLVNLTADVASVDAAVSGQEDLDNAITIAAGNRDGLRVPLRERVIQFREVVQYKLKGTGYPPSLPETPNDGSSEQKILKALDDVESLWVRINAETTIPNFTPPLLLRGSYPLATFQADVASLRTVYRALIDAENAARIGRNQRDLLLPPIRGRYVEYRQAIMIEYGADHPFANSLPEVTPPAGSTPAAVTLTGAWVPASEQAEFNWTASTNPNLSHYELRMSPGSSYDAATATVVASIPPGTTSFSTTASLENPGDVASLKVFVVLTTGNESGSNTVTITRP